MTGSLGAALLLVALQTDSLPPRTEPSDSALVAAPGIHLRIQGTAPLLGAAAVLPAGAASDPAGGSGTAWVYGRLLEAELSRRLRFSAATVRVSVRRFETVVTLLSPPESAARDLRQVEEAVGQRRFDLEDFERVKADLARQLRFERGAPVFTFEEERSSLMYDRRWGGTLQGRLEEVEALEAATLERWIARLDRAQITFVAVTPPGLALPATDLAQGPVRSAPPSASAVRWAWDDARHERLERSITHAWVTVDAPVRADLDPTAVDLLVHHLEEILSPTPPDPGIYSADVEVLRTPEGPVLSVTAAVAPEAAERWAARLEDAVRLEDLEAWTDERQFSWLRRRFRNAWLTREASPERAAERIARDLAAGHAPRDPLAETAHLEAGSLRALRDAVGPARVLVYGPVLGQS
ncbi:MAG: hypothetical protein R3E10_11040 [Gemmatimonadota bacterium]